MMIRRFPATWLYMSLLLGFSGAPVAAQHPDGTPPAIRVTGEATVTVQPDQAQIDLGVVTQAEQSETAARRNAQRVEAVLSRLAGVVGPDGKVETIGYSLRPDYRYPGDGREPAITGFTATNVVRMTLNDLDKVGRAIDAATASGANRIQALRFTLEDERTARAQALREAAASARAQADALAAALGVKIVRVLSASESGPPVMPVHDVAFARAESARVTTPIDPGTVEVRASVSLTVEVSSSQSRADVPNANGSTTIGGAIKDESGPDGAPCRRPVRPRRLRCGG